MMSSTRELTAQAAIDEATEYGNKGQSMSRAAAKELVAYIEALESNIDSSVIPVVRSHIYSPIRKQFRLRPEWGKK